MQFLNILGLWSLLFLIPLFIIYLKRPKPKTIEVPSLMFLMKDKGKSQNSLFRNFFKNLLFFLQMLLIVVLAFSVAKPEITLKTNLSEKNIVWVIDGSASTKALDQISPNIGLKDKTRFDSEIDYTLKHLGSKNSFVLINEIPRMIALGKDKSESVKILEKLKPLDLETSLGDSILAGGELLSKEKGNLAVVSDFIPTIGVDPIVAKRTLNSKGISVEFVNVGQNQNYDNKGFVDLAYNDEEAQLNIKNFNKEPFKVFINHKNKESLIERKEITIQADSIESVKFKLSKGMNIFQLEPKDDFPTDNILYISNPENKKINVLLISSVKNSFLESALSSIDVVNLKVAVPPIIPQERFDIYVIGEFNSELILKGTFEDIIDKVESGSSIIVQAQDSLFKSKVLDYLPVYFNSQLVYAIDTVIINKKELFGELDIGVLKKHYNATIKSGAMAIVEGNDGTVIVAAIKKNIGSVVYYGIPELENEFKVSTGYPVFWRRLIISLSNIANIQDYNYKTGQTLKIKEQEVTIPSGKIKTDSLFLGEAGIYKFDSKEVGVNFFSEKESDINSKELKTSILTVQDNLKIEKQQNVSLEIYLIAFGLFIVFIEFIIIKFRGDV